MDNPNNAWAHNSPPPPPQDFAPPPPPPKGLFVPPKGKSRGLAMAMVCLMALAQIISVLITNFGPSDLAADLFSNPLRFGLAALNLLLSLLVILKCVLPGWEPHRKILGWLLGAWALGSLAASAYGVFVGFQMVKESFGGFAFAGIAGTVGGAFGALYGIAASPQAILLFGIVAKKRTERIAGLVSAVSCSLSLLAIPLFWFFDRLLSSFAEPGSLDVPEALLSGTMLSSIVAGTVLSLCWAIFCFTWPVLERPVLEKT